MRKLFAPLFFVFILTSTLKAQHSVARKWNEVLLKAIRKDFARPTVHARNLFHTSVAMYDSWAIFNPDSDTYLIGQTVDGYTSAFSGINAPISSELDSAVHQAISYSCYRLLSHRFQNSPGKVESLARFDSLFTALGYERNYTSTDYSGGDYAALGNFIGEELINYGLQDGSNEQNDYANLFYSSVNPTLIPKISGNATIADPNRWQALTLDFFRDQSGNILPQNTPDFLSPEWGNVIPFALTDDEKTIKERNGETYTLYHDPGTPPLISDSLGLKDDYKWNFLMVALWSSHLDPADSVKWNISPGAKGNWNVDPWELDIRNCYDDTTGGDPSTGHLVNPSTGLPYEPQIVPRGDYARVLAEFWADGPDSETPPGHWFTILNYISDNPLLIKKLEGSGETLDELEWNVKTYLALGGAMHDAAICAWGAKGYYDYIRPVSAIRYMAGQGQSSDSTLPNFSRQGIPLVDGYVELVAVGDELALGKPANINKIKIKAWAGPDYISNTETDKAGVRWILAENWWPYQRPSFVTPPFAGYVSGHSVFSNTAANMLTLLTGDPFFPGGKGEFLAKKNEFLVFEEGPSEDIKLQWATYLDASNESSLSRIWGGIHPPIDDIPGRKMGTQVATNAFQKSKKLFNGVVSSLANKLDEKYIFSNPINKKRLTIQTTGEQNIRNIYLRNLQGTEVKNFRILQTHQQIGLDLNDVNSGSYLLSIESNIATKNYKVIVN